jgi:tetratricopeptide (TPR) repeat protein
MLNRLELLKRYLDEDPDDSFVRYAIALEYAAQGNHDQAFQQLKNLLKDEPDYLPAYYMCGKEAEHFEDFDEAKNLYLKGIEVAAMQKETHTLSELQSALEGLE